MRVIFLLCHIFVIQGKAQAPSFNWVKGAGTGSEQEGFAVAADQYGNVYETGFIKGSNVNFSSTLISSAGSEDIFISKYDQDGNLLWAKPAGGNGNDRGEGIAVDTAGNVYVCGYIEGTATFFGSPNITVSGPGTNDIFVAKYNSAGDVLWVKRAGASGDGAARAICTNGTNVFVTGEFAGNVSFGTLPALSSNGAKDIFISSYSCSAGTELWAIRGGGNQDDFGTGVALDATGIYVTGSFQNTGTFQNMSGNLSSNGNEDVFVLKYNFSGSGIWKRKAGGSNDDHETSVCANGTYVYVAGHFAGTMSLYNTSSTAVATITSAGADDAFLAQYDASTGNYGWVHSESGTNNDKARGVAVNPAGEIFVTGEFDGTLPLTPGPSITSAGNKDIFITKYNSSGTLLWGKKAGGSVEDYGMGIIAPDNTSVYIAGYFKSAPAVFDTLSISPSNNFDIFISKIGCTCTVADAGSNASYCELTTATLTGNSPVTGSGAWTLISGTGNITSPSSSSTTVTGLSSGPNVFQWTITNSVCPAASSAQVTIRIDDSATVADAGPDQTFCSSSGTLAGNIPVLGAGTWTRISGSGSPASPSSPSSGVTGLATGANVYQWTITNGVCVSSDQVVLNVDQNPTIANAGTDQTICSVSSVLAGNNPAIGTGTWSLVSGTGTITNAALYNSPVNGLSAGANVFRWTIANGTCPASSDLVTINVDQNPTVANAGPDQSTCNTSVSLAGNVPSVGTGIWTLVSGTGTIVTPNSATSTVTGLSLGANVFKWTISNGTCAPTNDNVTIFRDASPTTANAGPDQNTCSTSATLAGNNPATGTGVWTLISGTGVIANASLNNSTVTGLSIGNNVFQWTISNGTCASSSDQVTIHVDAFPTLSDAGPDQSVCTSTATLAGNTPTVGTGAWSLVSGTGSFTNSTSPTSGVTGLSVGANVFRWTITSGTCASSSDQVTITRDANPTTANAGPDQTLCTSATTLAGNNPAIGTGTWTLISGTGNITTPSSNSSGVTGLVTGNAVFQWTISNGTCPSSSDQVTIIHDANPSVADAGADQSVCSGNASLAGNVPASGTGTWTIISGTGTITSSASPTSGITGMSTGSNTFRWTISNGTCPSSSDDVVITRDANPTMANAGPDQTLCTPTTTLAGNNPVIGTGTWTLISGTGNITTPSSSSSGVTGLVTGNAVFQWTISNGTCPSSSDQVTIIHDANPSLANAGPDQTLCSGNSSFAGNIPTTGTGFWTLISGAGVITTPSSASSGVTGLSAGANVFQWTISNGTCPSSSDNVIITRDPNPTIANAGPDQTLCSSAATLGGNAPATGNGVWTTISGTGIATSPSSNSSGVTGLSIGANVFQWTISNGTCPSSSDQVTITRDANPTAANAGPDQTLCSGNSSFAGNAPATGTGVWTLVSGNGTISSPLSNTSAVTALSTGANTFQWTISNGTCPSSSDQVIITRDPLPTTANAGIDQTICSASSSFTANVPSTGTGLWTLISGTGTITTPTSPVSSVTGLSVGANVFQWTISNGTCASSSDQVTITRDANPTTADAGPDQVVCSTNSAFAGNTPTTGTGTWSLVSGTGSITTPSSATSAVVGLNTGNATFQWTISNGTCPSSSDQVIINRNSDPSIANAGPDQTICSSSATFAGNVPVVGTGTWTLISGTGVITSPSTSNSTVTGLSVGANIFRWTISNGVCTPTFDEVTINVDPNPTISNPGSNQTICSSTATLNANTPAIGTGAWTLVSGSATIVSPSSPGSTVNGLGAGTNIFQWTISNGTCPSSANQVTITRDEYPTAANAGLDQTICSSAASMNGNVPVVGVGTWSLISGTGNFSAPTSASSPVSGIGIGTSVYQWTISNGVCPSTSDQVSITVDDNPSPANAGPDQTICATSSSLTANIPVTGSGVWTLFSGTGVIVSPGSATTSITGMSSGSNIFQWTISNGTCPASVDQVTIFKDPEPTTADAGPDQTICSSSSSFAANTPAVGTGMWIVISGTGIISNTSSPTSGVTGLSLGVNKFCWKISYGTCPPSTDTMIINVDSNPSASNAGADQTICTSTTSLNGNFPSVGNGAWTLVSGTGTIVSPSSPNSTIVGLGIGANVFQWTISNGTCPSVSDEVIVSQDPVPTTANAGNDQTICSASTGFNGNTPVTGTGTWYLVSGTGSIVTPNSPSSIVNGLSVGANIFRWVITNGTCNASADTVIIYRDLNPTASNAGADQTICSSSVMLSGNAPAIGSGNWSLISGTGAIISPGSPATSVSGLSIGQNIFQWTNSNGTCPSSTDQVVINVDANPTLADAGNDISICSSVFSLGGNLPLTGTGNWNVIAGPGIISNPAQPNSGVSNLTTGNNIFEWVISNGTCPSSHDTVSVFVDQYPSASNAGVDQEICSSVSVLNGNAPVVGTGTWLIVNSTGNFADAAVPNSGITNLANGSNTFEWVITNGTCPASRDTVSILVDENPATANAGTDQTVCSSGATLHAVQPAIGTGVWNVLSGPGTVSNPLLENAPVSNLAMGQNEFQWIVSSGVCPVSADTVFIFVDSFPSIANAGNPQTICSSSSSLNANMPVFGTGSWTILSGTGVLADPLQPATAVSNLSYGPNLFEWSITSGSCPATRDTVVIDVDENPTAANAGPDILICDPADTLHANVPLVGSGTWYAINSPPLLGDPYVATTMVSNLIPGWNPFEWVISNGVCPASRDTVSVFYTIRPSAPDAGPDIYECAYDVAMQAEIPSVGTGLWNNLSNTGSFADANDPNSALNNLPAGSYLYTWTVSNSYCVSRPDTVMVSVYAPPSNADAGADQVVHTSFVTLHAIACDTGEGTWSFVSGSGQIEDVHDPATRVNELSEGTNILRWTTSNGVCAEKTDDVQIESKTLLIPTGYSPNNDGINDVFAIEGLPEYSNVSLEVFNRWGNQVYIASDYKNDWNGEGTNGEILPDDIYYFILKLDDGTSFTGYVALKRRTI